MAVAMQVGYVRAVCQAMVNYELRDKVRGRFTTARPIRLYCLLPLRAYVVVLATNASTRL